MYAGEQFDGAADLYYNRARYLDVNVGRFTGLDPLAGSESNPLTLNRYAYAALDPINNLDPSGGKTLLSVSAAREIVATLAEDYVKELGLNFVMDKMGGR